MTSVSLSSWSPWPSVARCATIGLAILAAASCGNPTEPSTPATAVVAVQSLTGCPYGVAVGKSGIGYVTSICGTSVTKFNATSRTLVAPVTVGSTPAHVAINPAGTTAYVANQFGQSVSVIDIATNTTTATISLAGSDAFNLRVSPNGSRLYVTRADGKLYVIDTSNRSTITTLTVGPAANGLAFHPTQPTLYVSSIQAGTVTAINTQTNTVTRTYTVGGMPQRIAISNDGSELYIANEISGMDVLDLSTGTHVSVALPRSNGSPGPGLGLALRARGDYAYVSMPNTGLVQVVDVKKREIFATIPVGGDPRNIAITNNGTVVVADQSGSLKFIR